MKKVILTSLAALLVCVSLFAQREETVFGKTGLRLSGAWGGSVVSLTSFADDYTVFSGGFGGLEFNKSLFLGWGGYQLEDEIQFPDLPQDRLQLDYNGLILGYGIKSHKVVHPQIMLLTGGGSARLRSEGAQRDRLFVVQPSVGVTVNVFRWLHIGLEGGYRFVNGTSIADLSDNDLSSAMGQIRFKFGWSWGRNDWSD